ncbi:MAG: hypothetical protein KGN36_01175 [Acidobacteriota bacterium]|nr:hypothetical protein [Acidobacteriota bacterium]
MTNSAPFALSVLLACAALPAQTLAPARMTKIGTVDPRYQSFNIEMVEVTGGRFWAPYKTAGAAPPPPPDAKLATPGIDPSLFRYRPPIDLANSRLRKLAAALGPSYVRVSGTWANSAYFHDSDTPAPKTPPPGFGGILTRPEWRGVIAFARAVDSRIVTSFTISGGVRSSDGVWTPAQAEKFLAFTRASGGSIAAAEFFNEPTFASMGGAPKGYDAAAYGRDFKIFRAMLRRVSPRTLILGPGSIGEAGGLSSFANLKSAGMLSASGPGVDAFSYHFYGTVSQRCAAMNPSLQTTPGAALSEDWLARTARDRDFYAALRDRFEPGKPLWLTETGETACGGNPWAATFLDSFRYLDQLGRLARSGVQVVIHNTLAASDYALIDEDTLTPRPNYWSAWLWRNLMGTTVLDPGPNPDPSVHLYAHCLRNHPGGVALLAINTSRDSAHDLSTSTPARRYTLTAPELTADTVQLNGQTLQTGPGDSLPQLASVPAPAGAVTLAPASITFLAFPAAANQSCRE